MNKLLKKPVVALMIAILIVNLFPAFAKAEDVNYEGGTEDPVQQNPVVEIAGTTYTSLADAVAESYDQAVLKLQADIFLANPVTISSAWNTKITLDLNGHTIRMYDVEENVAVDNSGAADDPTKGGMLILQNGTLELIDSSTEKTGLIDSTNKSDPIVVLKQDNNIGTYLSVTGGEYRTYDTQPAFELEDEYGNPLPNETVQQNTMLQASVSGGKFNKELPTVFLASGYGQQQDWEGKWEVVQVQTFTITWQNWDGSWLADASVAEGEVPVYPYDNPGRAEDDNYTYDFSGWDPAVGAVYADTIYTAQYTATAKTYTVTWQNWDGSLLDQTSVTAGETPVYPGENPGHDEDDDYTYEFSSWDPAVGAVYADTTYTAQYTATTKTKYYTITWQNWDGSWLADASVAEGEVPVYPGENPGHDDDDDYTYEFSGWDPAVGAVYADTTYTAQYTAIEKTKYYTVTWQNWEGTWLAETTVAEGEVPVYPGENPTHDPDAENTYNFTGWDPAVTAATADATYTAVYEAVPIPPVVVEYTITWQNWDGTWLETDYVQEQNVPVYQGTEPQHPADELYTYKFIGWEPAVAAAQADTTYTAVYKPSPRPVETQYTVTWQNYDYTVLQTNIVKEGETVEYQGETPVKPSDSKYNYVFAGWNPQVSPIYSDTIYTAAFHAVEKPETNQYTILWQNYDYSLMEMDIVFEGETPVYHGILPTRPYDYWYRYEFAGWNKAVVPAYEDTVYTAVYAVYPRESIYRITWKNWDGTVLYQSDVRGGRIPKYYGSVPYRASDKQFSYVFSGWTPKVVRAEYDAAYTATFIPVPITTQYNIIWQNWDGTTLDRIIVNNGEMPVYRGSVPVKPADSIYTYTFVGWDREVTAANADAVYVAQFKAVPAFDRGTVDLYQFDSVSVIEDYPVLYEAGTTDIAYVELSKAFETLQRAYAIKAGTAEDEEEAQEEGQAAANVSGQLILQPASQSADAANGQTAADGTAVPEEQLKEITFTTKYIKDGENLLFTAERENGSLVIINLADNTVTFTDYTGFSDHSLGIETENGSLLKEVSDTNTYPSLETEVVVSLNEYELPTYAIDGEGYLPLATFSDLFFVPEGMSWIYNGEDAFIVTDALDDTVLNEKGVTQKNIFEGIKDISQLLAPTSDLLMNLRDNSEDQKPVATGGAAAAQAAAGQALAQTAAAQSAVQTAAGGNNQASAQSAQIVQDSVTVSASSAKGIIEQPEQKRSSRMAMFTYHELCLLLDLNYGMKEDLDVKEGFDSFFREVGLYQSLISENTAVYETALRQLMEVYFVNDQENRLVNGYEEIGDTAYITIAQFTGSNADPAFRQILADAAACEPGSDEARAALNRLSGYTADNLAALAIFANNQITRPASPVKNIVFDISDTCGNDLEEAVYVMGWVLGTADIYLQDVLSGAHETTSYESDVTLDGVADAIDFNTYRVFCLISGETRDYGNLMASVFKASDDITVVGQSTGGGAHNLVTVVMPDGMTIQFAGLQEFCSFKAGAYTSIETGVDADVYVKNISIFRNRRQLNQFLAAIQ